MSEIELLFDVGDCVHPSVDPHADADDLVSALDYPYVLVDTYDGDNASRFIGRYVD
jgi:hypothetical protein